MESEWFHDAKDTKKTYWVDLRRNPEDCTRKEKKKIKVKPSVYEYFSTSSITGLPSKAYQRVVFP